MSDEERLRQQMGHIGVRYLGRTCGELVRLRELLHLALNGSPAMLKDLEHLAHKIHGSGAMFGFDALSDHAGEIEHIAGMLSKGEGPERFKHLSAAELRVRLSEAVAKLEEATRAAARERGVDVNVP